jgi:fused-like protein
VGNAGFHNDKLYADLRSAVPALVALLNDPEDKTRSNAAGALGNLARNSAALCPDLIAAHALEHMVDALEDPRTRKIALFSLGNFCVHRECKDVLVKMGFEEEMDKLANDPDPTVRKYLTRIKRNLTM